MECFCQHSKKANQNLKPKINDLLIALVMAPDSLQIKCNSWFDSLDNIETTECFYFGLNKLLGKLMLKPDEIALRWCVTRESAEYQEVQGELFSGILLMAAYGVD